MLQHSIGKCFLGKTLQLKTAKIELAITLDVGPRIISLNKVGQENILFNDIEDSVNNDCSGVYGAGAKWHIYGGHRVWLSPEDASTYYPDNTPCQYVVEGNKVTITSAEWQVKKVQPKLTITFVAEDSIVVDMSMKNTASTAQKLCIWGLTVMQAGGKLIVPLSQEDTGYLANRNIVFWSYDDIKDTRLDLQNDKIIMTSDKGIASPYKIGLYKKDVEAVYEIGKTTFIKKFSGQDGAEYPDYNCNLEAYMSNLIHEVESLSPMVDVNAGEELSHKEQWQIK